MGFIFYTMEQVFQSHNYPITILIKDGCIEFFKTSELERHNEYLSNLEDWQIDELDEYQKVCSNFYWIEVADWISEYKTTLQEKERTDNWHRHIKTKYWFTDEMYNWLNKQIIHKI